jgi:peptide/nickel transport system permease protein
MLRYVVRRVLYVIPTLVAISIVTFVVIQLPPGDFLTSTIARLRAQGDTVDLAQIEALRERYGLDEPIWVQYWVWISGIVFRGDFGESFAYNQPVSDLIGERIALSIVLSLSTLLFSWLLIFPIGIYSAMRKYSVGDYTFTFLGFVGLAIPNFLFALVLMYVSFAVLGQSVGGLFSPEYEDAAWNLGKVIDLLQHMWIPVLIISVASTAGGIRILRANLLDEIDKPYVETARAKGVPEARLVTKYPLRAAAIPFVSTVGWELPALISGEIIISVVLSLATTGPLLLEALRSQDMYLAGSFLLILSVLTVIGTLISDLLLAWLDPRIRLQHG